MALGEDSLQLYGIIIYRQTDWIYPNSSKRALAVKPDRC